MTYFHTCLLVKKKNEHLADRHLPDACLVDSHALGDGATPIKLFRLGWKGLPGTRTNL